VSIANSHHLDTELLSAYLDRELDQQRTGALENHLRDCAACRHELEQLRRVVTRLGQLDRGAPPPALELTVQRRIALQRSEERLFEKLERRLASVPLQPSVGVTFALVVAFAVMMYLLAAAVERRQSMVIPVVLDPELPTSAQTEGRPVAPPPTLTLGSWTFLLEDGRWRQAGLEEATPGRVLRWGSPEAEELLRSSPELAPLASQEKAVVLMVDARSVVELRPPAPEAGSD
jgi:hypothetical protein